jgi:hypothetical protein
VSNVLALVMTAAVAQGVVSPGEGAAQQAEGAAAAPAETVIEDPCWGQHPSGAFRTCFDPGRGLELTAGGSARSLTGAADFGLGIRLRGERDSSRNKASGTWLLSHHIASAEAHVSGTNRDFTLLGYEGIARRHVDEGSLLLPTTPPIRLPFPVDIGMYWRGLRYERRIEEGPGWVFETGRVGLLIDPLRSRSGRFHLGFGPVLAHQLRHDGVTLHNELTPLTALEVVVNAESENGLWVFRMSGWAGWTFSPENNQPNAALRARGELSLERVVVAINDQPISVCVRGGGAFHEAGALAQSEWSAGAALKMQLWAHR